MSQSLSDNTRQEFLQIGNAQSQSAFFNRPMIEFLEQVADRLPLMPGR